MTDEFEYPTADEIHDIHERIVTNNPETERGIRTPSAVGSALTYVSEGYFGQSPETIHEKAAHLMRLIAADHPYVDGNKRTALAAAGYLYDLNGYDFSVGDQIRKFLRDFATDADASTDDIETVVAYLRTHATTETVIQTEDNE